MTEISEAAKRKACELIRREWENSPDTFDHLTASRNALARVLQEHSDAAIEAAELLSDAELDGGPVYKKLQSLILPDEADALDKFAKWLNGCSKDGKKLQEAAAMFGLKIMETGDAPPEQVCKHNSHNRALGQVYHKCGECGAIIP